MTWLIPYHSVEKIHLNLRHELMTVFGAVLDENWFVLGKYLEHFEENFATYIGLKYAIGVGNGLDGLKIAIRSLGFVPGDEILIPALTFSASILAALEAGLRPVLVDVDPSTHLIDPLQAGKKMTPRCKAIMPVHLFGYPCEMDSVMRIAKEASLFVIEDYAQSVGARYRGRQTGSMGKINATSFYPVKPLGCLGDGGMITTQDPELRDLCRKYRNYGYTNKYRLDITGYNSRLDEIQAAFLSLKLPYIDQWRGEREEIANRYIQNLSGEKQIRLPVSGLHSQSAHHIFPIGIQDRDKLKKFLEKKGIQTGIHYPIPPHLQPGMKFLGYEEGDFPVTEKFCKTELSLPIYPGLTLKKIDLISENILSFIRGR